MLENVKRSEYTREITIQKLSIIIIKYWYCH